ncbi:MAG TPA: hypothetical protein DGT23_06505 [Micromonosporaceae bacterium]|nr:hypothetical protein [Micromonosporaceae bacterium]
MGTTQIATAIAAVTTANAVGCSS